MMSNEKQVQIVIKQIMIAVFVVGLIVTAWLLFSGRVDYDQQLQQQIEAQNIVALGTPHDQDPELILLGQALFFDKELSGNRDISCATCHHPTQGSGDGLAVSIGTGGEGLGPQREIGYGREFIPRNAPEVFNRGSEEWNTMFWDSRVFEENGMFHSPAGEMLPDGFDSVLAVQAMFPVTSADEMRGNPGDRDVYGQENELGLIDGDDFTGIWAALTDRLMQNPEYVTLFQNAFPDVPLDEIGFQHAANAIASFEIEAYTLPNSAWNIYLLGDTNALTSRQKQGATLFFGEANCSSCHTGSLLTDQKHHALAVPQVGPGKGDEAPFDLGRWRETGSTDDIYAFRTPSLHNVARSFPYMHDGAFLTLESAVLHHLDPERSLRNYDPTRNVIPELHDTFQSDEELITDMLRYIDPDLAPDRELTKAEVDSLVAFLHSLSDPELAHMSQYIPDSVPSGLPVSDELSTSAN